MARWQQIEEIHALTSEYKFISNELVDMQVCWSTTGDSMCTPVHQEKLQEKLDTICSMIKNISESL